MDKEKITDFEANWDKNIILEFNRRIDQGDKYLVSKEYEEIMQANILQSELGNRYVKRLVKVVGGENDNSCLFCEKPSREKTMICEECWKKYEDSEIAIDQKYGIDRMIQNVVPSKDAIHAYYEPHGKRKNRNWIVYLCILIAFAGIVLFARKLLEKPRYVLDYANEYVTAQTFLQQYELAVENNSQPMIGESMDIAFLYEGQSLGGEAYTLVVNDKPIRAGVILYADQSQSVKSVMVYVVQGGRYMYLMEQCLVKLTGTNMSDEEIKTMIGQNNPDNEALPFESDYVYIGDNNEFVLSEKDYYPTMVEQMQNVIMQPYQ